MKRFIIHGKVWKRFMAHSNSQSSTEIDFEYRLQINRRKPAPLPVFEALLRITFCVMMIQILKGFPSSTQTQTWRKNVEMTSMRISDFLQYPGKMRFSGWVQKASFKWTRMVHFSFYIWLLFLTLLSCQGKDIWLKSLLYWSTDWLVFGQCST